MRVLIIGAGLTGAAAARTLTAAGHDVRLVDKGRGVGGRIATRRVVLKPDGGEPQTLRFDHGAPAVSAGASAAFGAFLDEAKAAGVAAPWHGPAAPGDIVGVPSMRDLAAFAIAGHTVRTEATITALHRHGRQWCAVVEGADPVEADAVIVTVPAPQCAPLVAPHVRRFGDAAAAARYQPCWTAMLAFDDPVATTLAALQADALADHELTLIANGTKPGRGGAATLVMHAGPSLAEARLEEPRETMAAWFGDLAARGLGLPAPRFVTAHRWRYCRVAAAAAVEAPYDPELKLGVAGDWTAGPDAADAFGSGVSAATALLNAGA